MSGMDLHLDPLSPVPLYQQLRDRVVEAIAAGRLRRGETLLPVRKLAVAFGVNPATMAKGYDLLLSEGLVASSPKVGTFVVRDAGDPPTDPAFPASWTPRLHTLLAEARAQGLDPAAIRRHCDAVLDDLVGM